MKLAQITYEGRTYTADLSQGHDISIGLGRFASPNAFYLPQPEYATVEAGGFVGDVRRGGSCNVENICFSPHGNGTHTECAGHISPEPIRIGDVLQESFFLARLITIAPEESSEGNRVMDIQVESAFPANPEGCQAVIIRTLPNGESKRSHDWSGTNPPYLHAGAAAHLRKLGILHLLTDLPSLDKEDDGKLLAHHAFFMEPDGHYSRTHTVTEMIYVPDSLPDGLYWLNLQFVAFDSDAAPSKPILYELRPE